MASFQYIDGVREPTARRICKWSFGDYFYKLEKNDDIRTFDVYLHNDIDGVKVDMELIKLFNAEWGSQYRILLLGNVKEVQIR